MKYNINGSNHHKKNENHINSFWENAKTKIITIKIDNPYRKIFLKWFNNIQNKCKMNLKSLQIARQVDIELCKHKCNKWDVSSLLFFNSILLEFWYKIPEKIGSKCANFIPFNLSNISV